MIIIILGQPGSGKTLSAVRYMTNNSSSRCFTNFDTKLPNTTRLKWEHIFKEGKINWEFWKEQIKKYGGFHIIIDELHNVMHSRRSMSKQNVLLSTWVAQIRKVTGANEKYNFIVVSQELERIDVSVRDLASTIIVCDKAQSRVENTKILDRGRYKTIPVKRTYIRMTWFTNKQALTRYCNYRDNATKTYNYRSVFHGNPFMQYYDSYELIDFGNEEYV